jgi:hypothetical protein
MMLVGVVPGVVHAQRTRVSLFAEARIRERACPLEKAGQAAASSEHGEP